MEWLFLTIEICAKIDRLISTYFIEGWFFDSHVGIVLGLHTPSRQVAPIGSPEIASHYSHRDWDLVKRVNTLPAWSWSGVKS